MWVQWVLSTHRFQGKSTLRPSFFVKTGFSLSKVGNLHPQFSIPNEGPVWPYLAYQLSTFVFVTDSLEVENMKKDEEVTAMTTGGTTSTNETSEAENNTESYSIAGT